MSTDPYTPLRERYRPRQVRLLLIGESAPDPGDAERRFFYNATLHRHDNLFRGVVEALGRGPLGRAGSDKSRWLEAFRADGVFLIDLVQDPIDKRSRRERAQARRDGVSACVEHARALKPVGVVVCHGPTFDVLAEPLRAAGLPLLHDQRIPFPLGNHRARFTAMVGDALAPCPELRALIHTPPHPTEP
ncbi:MAG: hypothetical protein KBG48_09975 [Kofleriaceae bacterium]|nr:hypothetical protein [Kofleriaceae bacterium]MBP9167705.1 hypothetical protein [Kofleriaceae bacterium]MBP9857798.1 hypothetical protein [Kofleriaceae bacterium]